MHHLRMHFPLLTAVILTGDFSTMIRLVVPEVWDGGQKKIFLTFEARGQQKINTISYTYVPEDTSRPAVLVTLEYHKCNAFNALYERYLT